MFCGAFPGMLWDLLNVMFLVAKCYGTGFVTCGKYVMLLAAGRKCDQIENGKCYEYVKKKPKQCYEMLWRAKHVINLFFKAKQCYVAPKPKCYEYDTLESKTML